jgi:hypothetical protein
MRAELLAALAPREKRITLFDRPILVREMCVGSDIVAFQDGQDGFYKLLVRCAFDAETEEALFSDEDIPQLKGAGRKKMWALIEAVLEVNGHDIEAEIKNSDAAPSSG